MSTEHTPNVPKRTECLVEHSIHRIHEAKYKQRRRWTFQKAVSLNKSWEWKQHSYERTIVFQSLSVLRIYISSLFSHCCWSNETWLKKIEEKKSHSTQYFVCVRVWIRHMSYAFFKMKFHLLAKCFDFSYIQKQSGFEIFQLEWYGAITNSDFLCFLIISFYVELAFGSLELMLNRDSTN